VFSKDLTDGLLPFTIGRTVWDNWLIWHARDMKLPVVDASLAVMAFIKIMTTLTTCKA